MPSPIAHAAIGYWIYRGARSRFSKEAQSRVGPLPQLLAATVSLSLLPDLDSIPGILSGDFGRFHNNFSNSAFLGLVVALSVGSGVWLKQRSGFRRWFLTALLCYETHILMDYFTQGRGVMLAWPFSNERYAPPFPLFFGLRWSQGWVSVNHLWTLISEIGFVLVIWLLAHVVGMGKSFLKRQARVP